MMPFEIGGQFRPTSNLAAKSIGSLPSARGFGSPQDGQRLHLSHPARVCLIARSDDLKWSAGRGKSRAILMIGEQNHTIFCWRIEFGQRINRLVTIGRFDQ